MVSKICKRCGEHASLDDPFYRGFGAISRMDNKTMICSACGVDEAMENFLNGSMTPMSEWKYNK